MEAIKNNIKTIVGIVVVVFIVTFAYKYLQNPPENTAVKEEVVDESVDEVAAEMIRTLNELEKIKIDSKFFTEDFGDNPNLIPFKALIDFSAQEIQKKPLGKENPFSSRASSDRIESTNNSE